MSSPTIAEVAELINRPVEAFEGACHQTSLALVRNGILGPDARVARGFATGVGSQHSWVVVGDPYDWEAPIVDPTLWTYRDDVDDIWFGTRRDGQHFPHGGGLIWQAGRPVHHGGDDFILRKAGLSDDALMFLRMVEPLDEQGWRVLFNLPVEGWPAAEILDRMLDQQPDFNVWVPVDIVGMLTDRNPGGLYR